MSKVKIDPHGYRVHDDNNKSLIKKSLSECGAGRSILVDNDDVIVAGNGVYEQAQELGLKVRIIESDGSELIAIKRTDLSTQDEKRKLLALADNHTSDTSHFDFSAIVEDFDLDEIGDWGISVPDFSIDENQLNDFFSNEHNPQSSKQKSLICPHCGKNVYEHENTSDNAQ
ncbi:MAG: hypothetical protein ACRCUJ_06555 [Phocaeicola sp.]